MSDETHYLTSEEQKILDAALRKSSKIVHSNQLAEILRLRAENEKLREALNWFLNGAVPLGGLTRYEYEFVVEARKRAAALKEMGDE